MASVVVLASLYLFFVVHFSVNVPRLDDWSAVWIVSQAAGGHLTWSDLWTQHNANRMFVPNLFFVAIGLVSRENLRVVNVAGAVVLIGAFLLFLRLLRLYIGRVITVPLVLAVGVIWFSVADWGSAIWSFQFAWYLILLFFILMLLLLNNLTRLTLVLSICTAVAASFSSIEGLFLWPLGLIWIVWTSPPHPKRWDRIVSQGSLAWVIAALATTALYFVGYQTDPPYFGGFYPTSVLGVTGSTSSLGFVVHHPGPSIQFVFAEIGNVIPIGNALWPRELFGALLLAAAVTVVVMGLRHRRTEKRIDGLSVLLIGFALLFDFFLVAGRSNYGVTWAILPQYTMDNLLLLVGLLIYAWRHVPLRRSTILISVWITLMAVVALQVISSSEVGVAGGNSTWPTLEKEARLDTTTDLVPPAEHSCYLEVGLFDYILPNLSPSFVAQLKQQRLTIFAPGPYRHYRSEGLPMLPGCRKP